MIKFILPFIFIAYSYNGFSLSKHPLLLKVQVNGKFGYIDIRGKRIRPTKYLV